MSYSHPCFRYTQWQSGCQPCLRSTWRLSSTIGSVRDGERCLVNCALHAWRASRPEWHPHLCEMLPVASQWQALLLRTAGQVEQVCIVEPLQCPLVSVNIAMREVPLSFHWSSAFTSCLTNEFKSSQSLCPISSLTFSPFTVTERVSMCISCYGTC